MDLSWSKEQQMIRESTRDFLRDEEPRKILETEDFNEYREQLEDLWTKITELGWLALATDEQYGGDPGSDLDLGIIYEETGRSLFPTLFYSTLYGSYLLERVAGETQKEALLPEVADGDLTLTVAASEPEAIHDPGRFRTRAERRDGQWIINGAKEFVRDAALADRWILLARTDSAPVEQSLTAFLVDPESTDARATRHESFGNHPQSRLEFEDCVLPGDSLLGDPGEALEPYRRARSTATVLHCMEMVGGAREVLDRTVDYVSEREQFDQPIGSFQSVQHDCADAATQVDGSRLATLQALADHARDQGDSRKTTLAAAWTSEAYKDVTLTAHQLHGATGYVKDSDLYLWSERAKTTEILYGTRDRQLDKLATKFGLGRTPT